MKIVGPLLKMNFLVFIFFFVFSSVNAQRLDSALIWTLKEIHSIDAGQPVALADEAFLQVAFHGNGCISISTHCGEISGLYTYKTSGRSNRETDLIWVRARITDIDGCEDDLFREVVQRFQEVLLIKSQTIMSEIAVWFPPNVLTFQVSEVADTFNCIDACSLEPREGHCRALYIKYYYDQELQRCESFAWGGCGGNVPFETLEECQGWCRE